MSNKRKDNLTDVITIISQTPTPVNTGKPSGTVVYPTGEIVKLGLGGNKINKTVNFTNFIVNRSGQNGKGGNSKKK